MSDKLKFLFRNREPEPETGKRYNWKEMFDLRRELGRPLTEEEIRTFEIPTKPKKKKSPIKYIIPDYWYG